jgi:hypothetical protein
MPSKSLSEIKLKQTRTLTEAGSNGETLRKIMSVSEKMDEGEKCLSPFSVPLFYPPFLRRQ